MTSEWYPQNKKEISKILDTLLSQKIKQRKIHGLIVPHAGYFYSGKIAGQAYSMVKEVNKTAVILAPSHYIPILGAVTSSQMSWKTPLGEIVIQKNDFKKIDISREHAIDNQVPFVQKLGFKKILPLMIGEIDQKEAKRIAKKLAKIEDAVFIISTDLSHFLNYEEAIKRDNETIIAIKELDTNKLLRIENSACGIFPLLIFIELAKIKSWKPKLIEYKNSGDITGDKTSVVGYASFFF